MSRSDFLAHFHDYSFVTRRVDDVAFPASGCWEFPTAKYPKLRFRGESYAIHRLSLEIVRGVPLGELFACHTCDNPPCANPAHLFAGTTLENAIDMVNKGRGVVRPSPSLGESNGRAYPVQIVRQARSRYLEGISIAEVSREYGASWHAAHEWISGERSDAGSDIRRPSTPRQRGCGTRAGARTHERRGEPICEPCRSASRAYDRLKAQRKRERLKAAS